MYSYLYDAFVRDRRYESQVNRIEARIAELGLQGKVERLTILKNAKEIVEDSIRKGVETFIVVGDDSSISKVLTVLAKSTVTLGLIPIGPQQEISSLLGIPYGAAACETLSKRVIVKLDLGRANAQYFLRSLEVEKPSAVLESDRGYSITAFGSDDRIVIANFGTAPGFDPRSHQTDPADGQLDVVIGPAGKHSGFRFGRSTPRMSVFPVRRIRITCATESLMLVADGQNTVKTPALVEVIPGALRVIVGRDRTF